METFRCPTCIGVLPDARAKRCPYCGQNTRRRAPKVLGEETRIGASTLPIDRWMLERLHSDGRGRHALPPVAWHGKFATSPLAEPDFSATPVATATPLAPPTVAPEIVAPPAPAAPALASDDDHDHTPPVVGALALDVYTRPMIETDDVEVLEPEAKAEPEPETEAEPIADAAPPEPPLALASEPVYTPPPVPTPLPPAPVARPVTPPEELDPDVKALVDDLYKQAREELAGNDISFFTPMEAPAPRVEPIEDSIPATPIIATPTEAPMFEATPTYTPIFEPTPAPAEAPPVVEAPPTVEAAPEPPVADAPRPEAPRVEEAPRAQAVPPARRGWQPALVHDQNKRRHLSD